MIQNLDLQKIRQQLEAELTRLQSHVEGKSNNQDQRDGKNLDRDDLAHNFTMQERRSALRDVEETQIPQIEEALERIEAGNYGICASCGEAIEPGRLEIIPYATLCIRCQQEQNETQIN